jgi:glutathione S-transferase
VHLLLALLRMPYECVTLPFGAAKNRPPWFPEVNPRGIVPMLKADWLASDQPAIADVACYPHPARAEESGFNLRDYPAVTRWIERVETLPGWIARTGGAGRPWQ